MGNTFGQLFRVTTWGESHGAAIGAVVDGCPPRLELSEADIQPELDRRAPGQSALVTQRKESDTVRIMSGVFEGRTLGTPISLLIPNEDMRPGDYDEVREKYRPSHADYTYDAKYGIRDWRGGGRTSARETAARVAAGSIAKGFLGAVGVEIRSHVIQIASVSAPERDDLTPEDFEGVDDSPVRCLDADTSQAMVEEIDRLRKENESLGGKFEVRAFGLVPGIGSHASWSEKLDGRLAQAICSIQSVKGVSLGEAWEVAGKPGSEAHDEIFWSEERGWYRETNRAGGLEGGMTNGEPLVVQAAIKPISTMTQPLRSVDTETKEPAQAMRERTDSTVVPAAAVVAESMVALVVAGAYREKFGGDHIDDVQAALAAYKERIGWRR
jgi:chorismate synthase